MIGKYPNVLEANVFGISVPNYYGKSGMASITVTSEAEFDLHSFYKFVFQKLPSYAVPIFLRVRISENAKTATFKFLKHEYSRQSFNPSLVAENGCTDRLYFAHSSFGTYVPIDLNLYEQIVKNCFRL